MSRSTLAAVAASASALTASALVATTAQAVNYVEADNGATWEIHDAARPGLDTGSVRTITDSALLGFASIRVRVLPISDQDPSARLNGEMLRGFGLRFDGVEGFETTDAVTLGGVQVSRDIALRRSANYGRWLDTFTNTSDAPKTIEVSFGGTAGQNTGSNQSRIVATGSGDLLIGNTDAWVATGSVAATNPAPATGPSINGPSAVVLGTPSPFGGALVGSGIHQRDPFVNALPETGMEANFYGYRHRIVLAPGQTRTLMRYVVIGRDETTATAGQQIGMVTTAAQTLATAPDVTGMTPGEICSLANFNVMAIPGFDATDCADVPAPEAPAQQTPALATTTSPYDVVGRSLAEIKADLESGAATSQQVTRAYLDRIGAYDVGPFGFKAFISVNDEAMAQAREADRLRAAGDTRPMLGIPLAIKDNYDTKDMPTTNGTLALEDYVPDRDAGQVKRLRDAGAIFIGKANLSEFANSGGFSESGWGQTWNAINPSKTSFGSSGGTAVSVATSMAAGGLGSQTGVSLYAPSTGNGLATMRGTDGIASGAGVAPLTFLQDFGGPIARTVTDLALILNVTTGTDPDDVQTVDADADAVRPADWTASLNPAALQGKRLGIVPAAFGPPTYGDTRTVDALTARLDALRAAGAEVVDIPAPPGAPTAGQGFPQPSGTNRRSEGWERYFARSANPPFTSAAGVLSSPKVLPYNRQTLAESPGLTDDQVTQILTYRREYKRRLDAWMVENGVDAVVYPGFRSESFDNDGATLSSDRNTGIPVSNAGMPTVTVPVGRSPFGDVLALQILGKGFRDAEVLGYGFALEQQVNERIVAGSAPALRFDPGSQPQPPVVVEPGPDPETPAPEPQVPDNAGPGTPAPVAVGVPFPVIREIPAAPVRGPVRLSLRASTGDLRLRDGRIRLTLENQDPSALVTTLTLRTVLRGRRVTVGRATTRTTPGTQRRVSIRLSTTGRRLLRARRTLRTTIVATSLDPAGRLASTNRTVTVRR